MNIFFSWLFPVDSSAYSEICWEKVAGGKRNERLGATSGRRPQELKNSQREVAEIQAKYWWAPLTWKTCGVTIICSPFPFQWNQFYANITVKEVSEQSRELLCQALEEAQAELSRKFEIICEIRAIESLPHIRVKTFDDTEVSERIDVTSPFIPSCVTVYLSSRVRLQVISCMERCPWLSWGSVWHSCGKHSK